MLAQGRDGVAQELAAGGVPTLRGLADWLAPEGARGERATRVSERALFLPLHPFYRPADLVAVAEQLRRATLLVNGTGAGDPTEGSTTPAPILE